jgi:hypothetical protein
MKLPFSIFSFIFVTINKNLSSIPFFNRF